MLGARTLVVAAYPPELGDLAAGGVATAAIGIGAIDAAAGMAALIERARPDRVILVGTCGALPVAGAPAIGARVVVARARWADGGDGVVVPEAVVREAAADRPFAERLAVAAGARLVDATCAAGVTVDDAVAAQAASAGAQVEHMECFAVYRACVRAGVPACALLIVANRVGAGAREEWRKNARAAEAEGIAALRGALERMR